MSWTLKIKDQLVTHGDFMLTAEASTLGIRWIFPERIIYEGVEFNVLNRSSDREGELLWVDYRQSEGLVFRVWND
jgi:hypothetical protein